MARSPCFAWLSAVAGMLVVSTLSQSSEAASFACDRPAGARERLICGDGALSRADARLAASFRAALGALSDAGRTALRQSEREWLRFTDTVCSIDRLRGTDAQRLDTSLGCLKTEYAARQRQLDAAVTRRNDLVIRRVDIFKAVPSSDAGSGGAHAGFSSTMIAFPQIDRPGDPHEIRWNERVAKWAEGETGGSNDTGHDVVIDYTLGLVTPELISLMRYTYDDWHGAHGSADDKGITWLIREERELRPEDVFDPHSDWAPALARLVFERARREERREHRPFRVPPASELEAAVSEPSHWVLGERDLRIRFDPRDLGYNDPDIIDVKVPWRALSPYLARTALVAGFAK